MFLIHTAPEHAQTVARAVVAACKGERWCAQLQPKLLHTLFNELLDEDLDFETLEPNTLEDVSLRLTSADERLELIQLMCVVEILCNPIPIATEERIEEWARALQVPDRSLALCRDATRGEVRRAIEDIYRLNWIGDLSRRTPGFDALLEHSGAEAYAKTLEEDPAKAARYRGLSRCPEGSLGHHMAEFYEKRGFLVPGEAGAPSEAVAHHDWIHLITDYGTTPLGEIEAASFMATCSRAPGATVAVVAALALFESGVLPESMVTGGTMHQGISRPGGTERMAEAIARGKQCNTDLILDVDFFTMADEPLADVRERFNIVEKSKRVKELDPWGALEVEPA